MASPGGTRSPRKPWEVARSSSGTGGSIFMPPSSANSTAAVVESAGIADPPEKAAATNTATTAQNGAIVSRPQMPIRSYNTGYPNSNYSQYSSGYGNNAYGTSSYGGAYNNYNRGYGVGGGMYGGGYGVGSSYGGLYGNSYGGGMYGSGLGMGMGMGMGMGAPGMGMGMGIGDPNNPPEDGHPAGPPSIWQNVLKKMHWVVMVFGHIATLVSENAQTFHILSTALLQLFERSGMLYGELARFVLRILRWCRRPKSVLSKPSNPTLPGPPSSKNPAPSLQIEGPKGPSGSWDNVWGRDGV